MTTENTPDPITRDDLEEAMEGENNDVAEQFADDMYELIQRTDLLISELLPQENFLSVDIENMLEVGQLAQKLKYQFMELEQ